jgi:CheY-like chemotaxis protein
VSTDFRQLGILCVDDSHFLRGLMVDCLKALRVGHVHSAEDGKQAVNILTQRRNDAATAVVDPIDIIISNWQMKPGDGLSFLRWTRSDAQSVDPFMPFLLFTAYTDTEHVELARDKGADDVIAKPFSVKTVHDKILSLITRDIIFIECATYFGPDRRRQTMEYADAERRRTSDTHETVHVVTADHRLVRGEPLARDQIRIYRLKNSLADKLGLPSGLATVRLAEQEKQIEAGQKVLDRFAEKYPAYAEEQVLELLALRRNLERAEFDQVLSSGSLTILENIRSLTHDLVGQGGTFGFPLVTRAAKSLNRLAGRITRLDSRQSELIQTHMHLLQLILAERRSGENHPKVWEAIIGLEVAVEKCLG